MGNVIVLIVGRKGPNRLLIRGNDAYKHEHYQDAIEYHSRALARLKKPSLKRAKCLDELAKDFYRVGGIDKSLSTSMESLCIKEALVPRSDTVAKTLSNIGCIFFERADFMKALEVMEAALAIREELDPDSKDIAVTCNNMAMILTRLGRREEALRYNERARRIKERTRPSSISLATTYMNMSCCSKDFTHGIMMLDKARRIAERIKPAPKSLLALIDTNHGNFLMRAGKLKEAIQCYKSAIHREEEVAPESLTMATIQQHLATACDRAGLHAEARIARERSIGIRSRKAPSYLEKRLLKKPTHQSSSLSQS